MCSLILIIIIARHFCFQNFCRVSTHTLLFQFIWARPTCTLYILSIVQFCITLKPSKFPFKEAEQNKNKPLYIKAKEKTSHLSKRIENSKWVYVPFGLLMHKMAANSWLFHILTWWHDIAFSPYWQQDLKCL